MKIVNPSVELYPQEDYTLEGIYKQIEKCARVSYKSEDKMTETSSKEFVDRLIKAGHYAPLEFGTVYLYLEVNPDNGLSKFEYPLAGFTAHYNWSNVVGNIAARYRTNQYSKVDSKIETSTTEEGFVRVVDKYFITSNYRVIIENGWEDDLQFLCAPTEHHIKRLCVKFTTDIGAAREFTRHRTFSFMQESTRYCNYSKGKFNNELTFIKPYWYDKFNAPLDNTGHREDGTSDMFTSKDFEEFLMQCQCQYIAAIEAGARPQEARQILPLATKTELVMCGFEEDWNYFFDLRLRGTTGAPHPDAKLLAQMAWDLLKENYGVEL